MPSLFPATGDPDIHCKLMTRSAARARSQQHCGYGLKLATGLPSSWPSDNSHPVPSGRRQGPPPEMKGVRLLAITVFRSSAPGKTTGDGSWTSERVLLSTTHLLTDAPTHTSAALPLRSAGAGREKAAVSLQRPAVRREDPEVGLQAPAGGWERREERFGSVRARKADGVAGKPHGSAQVGRHECAEVHEGGHTKTARKPGDLRADKLRPAIVPIGRRPL